METAWEEQEVQHWQLKTKQSVKTFRNKNSATENLMMMMMMMMMMIIIIIIIIINPTEAKFWRQQGRNRKYNSWQLKAKQ